MSVGIYFRTLRLLYCNFYRGLGFWMWFSKVMIGSGPRPACRSSMVPIVLCFSIDRMRKCKKKKKLGKNWKFSTNFVVFPATKGRIWYLPSLVSTLRKSANKICKFDLRTNGQKCDQMLLTVDWTNSEDNVVDYPNSKITNLYRNRLVNE